MLDRGPLPHWMLVAYHLACVAIILPFEYIGSFILLLYLIGRNYRVILLYLIGIFFVSLLHRENEQ